MEGMKGSYEDMNLKTRIKNDLWQVNYIIPFTQKYLWGGKGYYIKKALPIIRDLKVIKGNGFNRYSCLDGTC